MGSRARIAAAACLLASGVWVGSAATATAIAFGDTGSAADDSSGRAGEASASDDGAAGRSGGADAKAEPARDDSRSDDRHSRDRDEADNELNDTDEDTDDPEDTDDTDDPGDPVDPDDPGDPVDGTDGNGEPNGTDGKGEPNGTDGGEPNGTDGNGEPTGTDGKGEQGHPCCDDGEDDCGGWPWPWPWPDPAEPATDVSDGGGPGGFIPAGPPAFRPIPVPATQVPSELLPIDEPTIPDVLDTVPDVGPSAAGSVGAPLSVPALPVGPGAGPSAAPAGAGPALPAAPRQATAQPPAARQPLPATAGSNVAVPASSYRLGYGEYLRTAGLPQVAALALPGVAGILLLTGAGGFVGYRQAKAGHVVRTSGTARFMN